MIRRLSMVALSTVVFAVGFTVVHAEPQADSASRLQAEVMKLQNMRIELLEQRVNKIKELVALDLTVASELIRPEIDLINARLDYTDSPAARKELLAELLAKHDKLIELAEFRVAQPAAPNSNRARIDRMAEADLLQLKSERVRIQILHELAN